MQKEYDLTTLKIKRRGILPGLQGQSSQEAKVKITVALDDDLATYFKAKAAQSAALPLQTLVNQTRQTLQPTVAQSPVELEAIKMALLQDAEFLREVANRVNHL
ncbi:MAG: hypothetical protein BWK78_08570 [Thiotrichaceae bacterium IS1]|nr:MAG: hypothetical protein BWK78_08570 [Thiotrichaceae bacterium IS1]